MAGYPSIHLSTLSLLVVSGLGRLAGLTQASTKRLTSRVFEGNLFTLMRPHLPRSGTPPRTFNSKGNLRISAGAEPAFLGFEVLSGLIVVLMAAAILMVGGLLLPAQWTLPDTVYWFALLQSFLPR